MRGRKPTPTALHALHGNPSKLPPRQGEPEPTGKLDEPPVWFDDAQKEIWRYNIDHLPPGMLGAVDRAVLQVEVVAESLHRKAAALQNGLGLIVKATPTSDALIQSPYLAIINKQASLVLKAAELLGMSPVARARLGRDVAAEPMGKPAVKASSRGSKVVSLDAYLSSHPNARTG